MSPRMRINLRSHKEEANEEQNFCRSLARFSSAVHF
jgi:hypothetical protein